MAQNEPLPLRIDAHQHFWNFDPIRDSWITDEMKVIKKDFLPGDLQPLLQANGIDGCITVQVDQSEDENDYLLSNAGQHDFIKGVVGWVNLQDPDVERRLEHLTKFPKLKGFRHILQGEHDRALMLKPSFKRGIGLLKAYGYTYDVLIYPDQLGYTSEFVAAFPDQPFVLDHIAKPHIKDRYITDEWKDAMRAVAAHPNLYCKISGMVTEADWYHWKPEHFRVYLDTVVEAFGTQRILYGSDWPVCLVAASYQQVFGIVKDYFSTFSKDEQDAFFGGNAIKFYKL
ncbi:amidohydrolase family protein [Puia dinghuensis]|uniref:Amidohydrolase n=1 Tax=Puia dinghuensis TaxID=1792502 RepID=A0A8J2UI53_9BACT|nr:amidohydrolase family protein [Puia dinghuensis]GGB21358.1 amidohydrolase [Puia dinghuensis]